MRVDELAHGAGLEFHRLARVRIDQLHPDVAAAAEVHALLLRALAEQRRRYVANPHNLGDGDAENRLDVIADLRDPAARLAAGDDMGERRGSVVQVGAAWRRDQVGKELRERGRGQKRVGEAGFQAEDDAVGVAGRHRHRTATDARQHEMRVSSHERTGAKGRQHAAVIVNPSGEICPRADCRPHLDIAAREREHAGCARGAAGLIDPLDLFMRDAEIAAERRRLVDRLLELLLRAER